MPGSGNKGDRGPAGGGGFGGGRGGPGGASGGGGKESRSQNFGGTFAGRGFGSPGGYSAVTGQERMARPSERMASSSMSGFANGTSSGAAPTGIGGGFGGGMGTTGMRAAQVGRDAFAAAQRAAASPSRASPSRVAAPRVSVRPPVIARPPVTVAPPVAAPPPNIAKMAFAPTLARLQAPVSALTSPNMAMNPGMIGVMAASQVPGYSSPSPTRGLPAAVGPNMSTQSPTQAAPSAVGTGTAGIPGGVPASHRKDNTPASSVGPPAGMNSSTHGKNQNSPAVGGTGTGGMPGGVPAGHRRDNSLAGERAPSAPGLPGSAGDTGTMGVPGGLQARGTGSPASRGVPGRPGDGLPMGGYSDAGQRFGKNTGLVGGFRGSGDLGDPGVTGVQGGLAARGTTEAQALAKAAVDSGWGRAAPTQAATVMARAVKGELGPNATAALAAAQQAGFSPGAMMAAMASMNPTANMNFTKGWQAQNMDPRVQAKMNELAKILGIKDFTIVSGYRSPAYNAALAKKSKGVAKKSQHMRGTAVDVAYPKGVTTEAQRQAFARAMREAGFTGIGYYGGWVHGDLGPTRGWGDNSSRDAFAKGLAGGK